ncbi:hypothetical protein AB5I41_29045 [Sphingomonas sp. MMS24-JH45]
MTAVFLTIDTEFAWRHHAAGHDAATIHARSVEPAGVGLTAQLEHARAVRSKATFFVDPMPALVHGLSVDRSARWPRCWRRAGGATLHLHANWHGASAADRTRHGRFELTDDQLRRASARCWRR